MKKPSNPEEYFYFELCADGDHIPFLQVEGVSIKVHAKSSIKEGENPFKYHLPSLPKTGSLILKKGQAKHDSKLMQWCAASKTKETVTREDRNKLLLQLKDSHGRSWVEWSLYSAYPVQNHSSLLKSRDTEIEDLELAYSFYSMTKK